MPSGKKQVTRAQVLGKGGGLTDQSLGELRLLMRDYGLSCRDAAKEVGCSWRIAAKWARNNFKRDETTDRGRKENTILLRLLKQLCVDSGPFKGTNKMLLRRVNGELDNPITLRTMQRNMRKLDVVDKVPRSKSTINAATIEKRLAYGKNTLRTTTEAGRLMWFFVDESSICVHLRKPRYKGKRGTIVPFHAQGRRQGNLIHYAVIYSPGHGVKGDLLYLEPKVTWTGENCVKAMEIWLADLNPPQGSTFVLDNPNTHNAVKDFLRSKGMIVAPHPPSSPDLNPIENIFDGLKDAVAYREPQPRGRAQVLEALDEEWGAVTKDHLAKFVLSNKRLQAVVDAMGFPTKY